MLPRARKAQEITDVRIQEHVFAVHIFHIQPVSSGKSVRAGERKKYYKDGAAAIVMVKGI